MVMNGLNISAHILSLPTVFICSSKDRNCVYSPILRRLEVWGLDDYISSFQWDLDCSVLLCVVLLPTLHNGHHSSADAGHHITQQPLFNPVAPQPANDRQKREDGILGPF